MKVARIHQHGGPVSTRASICRFLFGKQWSLLGSFILAGGKEVAMLKLVTWAQVPPANRDRKPLEPARAMDAVPDAADWLDSSRILANVAVTAGAGHVLSAPVLTYDRDPSRLVWMVESRGPGGTVQRWFSAGRSVWQDSGDEDVTGGPPR